MVSYIVCCSALLPVLNITPAVSHSPAPSFHVRYHLLTFRLRPASLDLGASSALKGLAALTGFGFIHPSSLFQSIHSFDIGVFNNQVLSKLLYTPYPRVGLEFSRGERPEANKGSPVTDVTKGKNYGSEKTDVVGALHSRCIQLCCPARKCLLTKHVWVPAFCSDTNLQPELECFPQLGVSWLLLGRCSVTCNEVLYSQI